MSNLREDPSDICVVGLGKLGLSFAAVLADAGFTVYGVDKDERVIERVADADPSYPEPDLGDHLARNASNVNPTTSVEEGVSNAEMTFVFVNTPLNDGDHSLDQVKGAVRDVGGALEDDDEFHTVVVRSTVTPGTTAEKIAPWLESAAGREVGADVGLCYHPEFSAIGEIIESLRAPDFFLVGEADERGGDTLERVCKQLRRNDAAVIRTDPATAEVAKMANNTFRTLKISFANTVGEIADEVGADAGDIVESFDHDSNIEARYLVPGTRYGGPCYSRDNVVFDRFSRSVGAPGDLPVAADAVNDHHTDWIAELVRAQTEDGGSVGVLGMTYKPDSYLLKESQGKHLIEALDGEYDLHWTNPWEIVDVEELQTDAARQHESPSDLLGACQTAIVAIPWEEYLSPDLYANYELTLVDPWRAVDTGGLPETVGYVPMAGKSR
jgi:UDPglucose 6-dehydrogenase